MIDFTALATECSPDIHPKTIQAVVRTESSYNPFAIGVVNGKLSRQPHNISEAVSTANMLEKSGYNYSLGLSQVNKHNLHHYGLTLASAFSPCTNIKTGAQILKACYTQAESKSSNPQTALRAALSCYYSGNMTTGFVKDYNNTSYVQRVVNNAVLAKNENPAMAIPEIAPDSTPDAITVKPVQPPKEKVAPFIATPPDEKGNTDSDNNKSKGQSWDVFNDF